MGLQIERFREVVVTAADDVTAREKDGSFLERKLRDAIAAHLPGSMIEQRLGLPTWSASLGGVDVQFRWPHTDEDLGVETKVWDVEDSLFDILKLAAGTQRRPLTTGYAVIAARTTDWRRPSVVSAMSSFAHPACLSTIWSTAAVLRTEGDRWAKTWARCSARPRALPERFLTSATAPVDMANAPGHELRIIAVKAVGLHQVAVGDDGQVSGKWGESAAGLLHEEDPPSPGDSGGSPTRPRI